MKQITWEKFARARAQLDAGLDRDVVLAAVNLDAPTWISEEEALLAALADDVERADFSHIEAFRAAYRITWTELTGLAPTDPTPIAPPVSLQDESLLLAGVARVPAGHPVDQTLPAPGLTASAKDPLPFLPQAPATPEALSRTTPGPSNSPAPRLTLEQYASLCVEIAVFPRHVEAIFQRYGLVSQSQRLTLDLTWQERLRRNSTEYGEWQRLYQHYQAYWTDPARGDGPWQSG